MAAWAWKWREIRCKGVIHSHRTISRRNLVLSQLALRLFQVAEAQLGNRKDLGLKGAPNQLSRRISLPPMHIRAKYVFDGL
jgi:hypothetical protein